MDHLHTQRSRAGAGALCDLPLVPVWQEHIDRTVRELEQQIFAAGRHDVRPMFAEVRRFEDVRTGSGAVEETLRR